MTVLSDKPRVGAYLVSEAEGTRSREQVTFLTGAVIEPGTVLGKVTASGKYVPLNEAGADGSQNPAGIAWGHVDASAGDKKGVITARDAEVNKSLLIWPGTYDAANIAAALATLATTFGIIGR